MRLHLPRGLVATLASIPFFFVGRAEAVPITLADASAGVVAFEQLNFRSAPNSGVGEVTVFRDAMAAQTGISSGFLNVMSGTDWVVRNLPMLTEFEASSSTTRFDLGIADGSALLTSMNLSVDFSATPTASFSPGAFFDFAVTQTDFAAGGVEDDLAGYMARPDLTPLTFSPLRSSALLENFEQKGHTNVQAADSQCAPAAVANSLDWLKKTQGLPVPHENKPGLKGDDTLVGKLDTAIDWPVTSRASGSGRWPLDGKLKYISENGLKDKLLVEHRGDGFTRGDPNVKLTGKENITRYGVTSYGQGDKVTWDWINSELKKGEDVEINLAYKSGAAHYVNVIGSGTILGIPYIRHISDHAQSDVDPMDNKGTDKVDFEWMIGDQVLNSNATIDQAISESVVPEPATLTLVGIGVLALARSARRRTRKKDV